MTTADGLGARIRSGIAWKAASQLTLQVSRVVVALVLARLLAPEDWGVAAMVLVISGFVVVFTDSALGTALIQRRDLTEDDRSTVFWASVGIGVLLMLAGIALAGPIAAFYGEPDVEPLFVAMSVGFLVTALGAAHSAVLARELQFRTLELRQIAATVAGACAGITIALRGGGAWAIIGQLLVESVVSTAIVWLVTPWRPHLTFSVGSLRRLGGFAGNVFGENLLYQAGKNLSGLLIGRFLGAAAVGAYVLASNVILVPFSRLAAPLQQVFFPAFSRINDDRTRLGDIWLRATRLVALVAVPALVGLVVVAEDFVAVVLGPKWNDATPVIQILAWVGIIQALQTLNGEVLLAVGKASTLLRFTMLWFIGTVVAFAVGVQWGIVGVAAAYLVAAVLIEPIKTVLTLRAVELSISAYVRTLSGVFQAAALMAAALLVSRAVLTGSEADAALRLVVLIVVGVVVYVPACLWRAPEVTGEVRRALGRPRFSRGQRDLLAQNALEP